MGVSRRPFQGVINIIRFNWHFYILASVVIIALIFFSNYTSDYGLFALILAAFIFIPILFSLIVSYYIYDYAGIYKLDWLPEESGHQTIVNIHAGFDETSTLINHRFAESELIVYDFYDPLLHTEVSIKRARKVYPAYPNTIKISTSAIPLPDNSCDMIFLIFAAHEIRDQQERLQFFKSLKNKLKHDGRIYVIEHLRDLPNFIAFNIGFLHFYSEDNWLYIFKNSGLRLTKVNKLTSFISIFQLTINGDSL